MSGNRVLIVDDEVKMQRLLEIMLKKQGHEVLRAGNGREALALAEHETFDLVITDLKMPEMDGMDLLRELRALHEETPVIIMTAYGTVESAVTAMKYGAADYLIRPFEMETVELAVARALALGQMQRENRYLRDEVEKGWDEFIGRSPAMREVYALIRQVAPARTPVLVMGETGTGKELVARAIHKASGRQGLFVPINCAAIPADILESEMFGYVKGAFTGAQRDRVGKFELAHGGTLFLDEVTEMSTPLQAKLLRALQDGRIERLGSNHVIDIDIRVIAATNHDPQAAVREQRLREDLYYRLNVIAIPLPPLRDRREDIVLLAEHFLGKHAARMGRTVPPLSESARRHLIDHDWPGNVRELENAMERALVIGPGDVVDAVHLPPVEMAAGTEARPRPPTGGDGDWALQPQIDALEKRLIKRALAETGGNKSAASRLLQISERSLWYKLKKFGLGAG